MARPSVHSAIVAVTAPAKLNLFLHVVGRRADGYHELESLFAFSKKGDELQVQAASQFRFTLTGPFAAELTALGGGGEDNLVCRAIKRLAEKAKRAPHVAVTLKKNLPVAAGIGGGSADAAAALLALNEFWGLNLSVEELEIIALELGADVPACLHRRPLFVQGIGDRLVPVTLGFRASVLLANPCKEVSTPSIFRALKAKDVPFDALLPRPDQLWSSLSALDAETHNSLQPVASELCPEVSEVLQALQSVPKARLVRMSGSGATCFALFDRAEDAAAAHQRLQAVHPDWWFQLDELSG